MKLEDVFKIIVTMLGSVGSAAFIFFALSSWLGKVWASRILEKEKSAHEKEIEKYRHDLEQIKITLLRYSNKQFELYGVLWDSLCDLENVGDTLYQETNIQNLNKFIDQFRLTSLSVRKGFIFIEDVHYNKLKSLFEVAKNYQYGKQKLLEIRRNNNPGDQTVATNYVLINSEWLNEYSELLEEIGRDFKRQLK